MEPKLSNPVALNWLKHFNVGDERSTYKVEFEIDSDLGFSGAITVTNKYDKEIFLEGFSIEGACCGYCLQFLDSTLKVHPEERIFFTGLYATRTILYLTRLGTLKSIAIELSLPESKQQIAKAHVCFNDAGVHQLVHHWLRIHACMEPFIIAAHRHLSVMHPVFKLLKPHLKHTLQINALALINEGGIIESDFSAGKHSTEIISAAYKDWWRFDMEAILADLIRRGLAEPDPTQPYGLRLLIEDYPYANDGLLYSELQAWYSEVINVGHADHANVSWWPTLSTPNDHTHMGCFGSAFSGEFWAITSWWKLLPKEEDSEYKDFLEDPEGYLLSCLPNLLETTKFLAVVNILSQHSPDEECIGQRKDLSDWTGDTEIIQAFYEFSMDIKIIEKEIDKRNKDPTRRNRCGAGIPPYESLIASSGPGVTGRGVPNSISI
uniref:Lipoxygenase domain-containing protein n=1 Tax=Glycine max TaxID=3847 RepID=A0A0R0G4J5_SOYBN